MDPALRTRFAMVVVDLVERDIDVTRPGFVVRVVYKGIHLNPCGECGKDGATRWCKCRRVMFHHNCFDAGWEHHQFFCTTHHRDLRNEILSAIRNQMRRENQDRCRFALTIINQVLGDAIDKYVHANKIENKTKLQRIVDAWGDVKQNNRLMCMCGPCKCCGNGCHCGVRAGKASGKPT